MRAAAPGKVNLCLFVGPVRDDGYHELVSVLQPVSLVDEVELEPAHDLADRVECPGVPGDNLAARALAAFRAHTSWDGPPQVVRIDKRIPVAAGMGGGSSDAATTLALLAGAAGIPRAQVAGLAFGLGADVPALLHGGTVLVRGAGEHVAPAATPDQAYLILPSTTQLSTPAVFAAADRLRPPRTRAELEDIARAVANGVIEPVNDLQDAARSLCPEVDGALVEAREAGARHALVSGSGPTVFGVFDTPAGAHAAAAGLAGRPGGAHAVEAWS